VKDKKEHQDAVKLNRKAIKEARGETVGGVEVVQAAAGADRVAEKWKKKGLSVPTLPGGEGEGGDDDDDDEEEEEEEGEQEQTYQDAGTVGMFGGTVSVQVGLGVGEEEEGDLAVAEVAAAAARLRARAAARKPQLSKLEKAVRKVQQSGALNKKKKKKADGDSEVTASDRRFVCVFVCVTHSLLPSPSLPLTPHLSPLTSLTLHQKKHKNTLGAAVTAPQWERRA